VELITNPAVILLDEPTTGLDSASALSVMQILRGLADAGKTVVCTVHQPSGEIYSLAERLLIML
jgi:ABC-type multidrug transport system ATPase subunit